MPRRRSDKPRHPRRRHPTVRDISSGVGPAPGQVAASNLLDSRRRKESIDVYGFLIGEAAGALLVVSVSAVSAGPFSTTWTRHWEINRVAAGRVRFRAGNLRQAAGQRKE